jgi:phosphoribosylformylglycinamidine synthase subunit PurS
MVGDIVLKAKVTVYPRPEILDPQGKAIHQSLQRIGFEGVTKVRAGKSFEIELTAADAGDAREQLDHMCRKLLANTVVEDYAVELLPGEPA